MPIPTLADFRAVRDHTDSLSAALSAEDQCVQSMPDASPAKWHRAHTSWFFETFILLPHAPGYRAFSADFSYLFNSYYEAVGARHPRPQRGLLTRPTANEISQYRAHIDHAMVQFLPSISPEIFPLITLGLHHEQQHQELLLTDILDAFAHNPLSPAAIPGWCTPVGATGPTKFIAFPGGLTTIGATGHSFNFDNETPAHQTFLAPYRLANRLVRNSEFLAFIDAGGYRAPSLWMSEGNDAARANGWETPLHWRQTDHGWHQFTLGGLQPLEPDEPVRHLSWYEADAFARWSGGRLPTEAELEAASGQIDEFTGHVWQWTSSAYSPYPGFRAASGAIGEYNGKFMINQMVLRGGSAATPAGHTRPSYRNFFHPDRRWQFTGLRLALDF